METRLAGVPGCQFCAIVHRNGVSAHLMRVGEAPYGLRSPVQAQFWISSDLDELFRQAETHGAKILQPPEDRPRGHRDFMITDPDGNVVWVTTALATGPAAAS